MKKHSPKIKQFIISLVREVKEDELISLSNELTYKLLLALFPFIIFAMSLIGFFNLEGNMLLEQMDEALPMEIYNLLYVFITEIVNEKSPGVLSFSLIISVFSASSGLNAIIRGVNKAYGQPETRNFVVVRLISIFLTVIFAIILLISTALFVFKDKLYNLINDYLQYESFVDTFFSFTGYLIFVFILFFVTMIINKFASCKKIKLISTVPGALVTVLIWLFASKVFNIYINNFSRFSTIYGSIGSVFILMFWLNIISAALLLGSEINALLDDA